MPHSHGNITFFLSLISINCIISVLFTLAFQHGVCLFGNEYRIETIQVLKTEKLFVLSPYPWVEGTEGTA